MGIIILAVSDICSSNLGDFSSRSVLGQRRPRLVPGTCVVKYFNFSKTGKPGHSAGTTGLPAAMPTTRAQNRHQNARDRCSLNSPSETPSAVTQETRQHLTGLEAGLPETSEGASYLLILPTETRLQIYQYLLLPEFPEDAERRSSARPDDLRDTDQLSHQLSSEYSSTSDENGDRLTYDAFQKERSKSTVAKTELPTRRNRKTYGQLLLVCKTIHHEAAPLFFSRATFFIKEPFQFANMFLRKLALDKIYALRHLELRMAVLDFDYRSPAKPRRRIRVLSNLVKLFQTYHKELSGLDSMVLSLKVNGSTFRTNFDSDVLFCGIEAGPLQSRWWLHMPMDCMLEAGSALLKVMNVAHFRLFETQEQAYEKVTGHRYLTYRGTVACVKLQRRR